jgi:hypothetical protein
MANKYWCTGGNGNWSSSTNWSTTSGASRAANTTQPSGSDVAIFDGISGTGNVKIDSGIASFDTLNITSFAGSFEFVSPITLNATSGICFIGSPASGFSVTGTPQINLTGAPTTGTRTLNVGTFTQAQSFNFNISAGDTGCIILFSSNSYVRNITFSGSFTGQFQSGTTSILTYIYGDLTFKAGMTVNNPTNGQTKLFISSSGTQKITSAGLPLGFPITIGTGSSTNTLQLQDDLTIGSSTARTITLLSGTLDLNDKTLTHLGNFSSNNSNTRSISGSTSLSVIKNTNTGTGTYWDCATATGFTKIGNPSVQFTGTNTSASTLTVLHGTTAGAEANAMSFFFGSAPTVVLANTNEIADLGVLPSSSITLSGGATGRTIYGGFFGGVSTTSSANPFGVLTFASTSATARNIYLSSASNIIFDGVGGSWQLSGAVSTSVTFTLTNGTFSTNGFNLSVGTFNFNNSNTKTLTINSTLTINGGQFIGSATGTTTNFSGFTLTGGGTVNTPNITIPTVTTTSSFIIGSALSTQTITNLTTTTACIVYLYGTSTLNVTNLSLYGDSGGNGSLTAYPTGTATLSKASGTVITSYQTISNIIATGGATWRAPTNAPYNNVDGGGNTGWIFTPIGGGGGNFLMFF